MTFLRHSLRFPIPNARPALRQWTPPALTTTRSSSFRTFSTAKDPPSSPTPESTNDELAGTAPPHHCYVLLHTPHPPSTYPAKFATPVQRKLLMATMPYGGSVNFAWSESEGVTSSSSSSRARQTSTTTGADIHMDTRADQGTSAQDTYRLTAFSSTRGKLEIEDVSLANVDEVGRALQAHIEPLPAEASSNTPATDDSIHLYVCTHGARDCRCGTTGGAVANAIRAELHKRRQVNPSDPSTCIKLAEVAHVGGHKYAANILVYPHGDWLGRVNPENVPEIIDAILERPIRPMLPEDMPICPAHWRGRMGLNKEEQAELFRTWKDRSQI